MSAAAVLRSACRRALRRLPRETIVPRPRLYSSERIVGNTTKYGAVEKRVSSSSSIRELELLLEEQIALSKQLHHNLRESHELEPEARGRRVLFCGVAIIAGIVMFVKQGSKKNKATATEEKTTS